MEPRSLVLNMASTGELAQLQAPRPCLSLPPSCVKQFLELFCYTVSMCKLSQTQKGLVYNMHSRIHSAYQWETASEAANTIYPKT